MKLGIKNEELKTFLDEKVERFNQPNFIENDPIQIPHLFSNPRDIEVAGFLTATIAWGKREMIIRNAKRIMELMDQSPYDFVMNHQIGDLNSFDGFVHRTFNAEDLKFFIQRLKIIYQDYGTLESAFYQEDVTDNMKLSLGQFHEIFFSDIKRPHRAQKHIANPMRGSSAKRLNMFLRWMVRKDSKKVDFGIWDNIPTSKLSCPLDVHTGNVGRILGFIERKQNDWKTVEELDQSLRKFDPIDPVKYDFALFGLGVDEGWK